MSALDFSYIFQDEQVMRNPFASILTITIAVVLSGQFVTSGLAATVVINEIHYHPLSEDIREEYIELLNTGTTTVDLTGWRFSNSIDYTFPAVSLPPGGLWPANK